jgi:LmbE family N-acetylglucosaminyl deacetylase
MQHDPFEPSFVVDVTAVWEAKQRALDCYRSQLHPGGSAPADDRGGAPTKVGSRSSGSPWKAAPGISG